MTSPGLADAPIISLAACEVLEQMFVTVVGTDISFHALAYTLSSVTSSRFQKLILEFRTVAQRGPDHVQVDLVDRLSQLDWPLSQLARAASEKRREVSLTLLGQDPEFLAQGFMDFQSLGCVWAGEEVGKGKYLWTFTAPKNVTRRRVNIFDRLFRWRIR